LLSGKTYRQLLLITQALLAMTGRITMLGISRWAGKGGSYRTIQRFFRSKLPWESLNWAIAKTFVKQAEGEVVIAGDGTTVLKSGKETYGLGKFFSSLYSRAVTGLGFQTLSLLDGEQGKSWPILVEQILPQPKEEKESAPKEKRTKRGRGRPKGSKNKNQRQVELNAEMTQVQTMLLKVLKMLEGLLIPTHFVYDGAFGNNAAVQMTRQVGLDLISKLRYDSGLYFKWNGVYSGRGRRPIYGNKIDYHNLPSVYLKSEQTHEDILTRIYQIQVRHKKFADILNVVIICKENLKTGQSARVILFTTDLALGWFKIIHYYRLRFQIEFNFRDAKQYWGLEDFMVIKQQSVLNAANLSLFMVNVSQAMLARSGEHSILDLKARHHGLRYAQELFKLLPQNLQAINIQRLLDKLPVLGRIHGKNIAA
jgi:putative transposase